jgi:hypothetical protein
VSPRLEIASRVLAGFAANPAVFAHNQRSGWSLVNTTENYLASYAMKLADELIDAGELPRTTAKNTEAEK